MRNILLLITVICFSLPLSAQQNIYKKQWQEIDSLIVLKDLPKTALEKVNILYADAKSKNIHNEIIKALLYQLSLSQKTTDEDINKQLVRVKHELQTTNNPVSRSILLSLLANNINNYYNHNFWKKRQRKEADYKDADITTWDNGRLIQTIDSLYTAALSPKQLLQQTATNPLSAILIKGNMPGTRPTVYDL